MPVVRNIITRVGADASPLTEEMKKAQNTILSFKNESMSALKSFGIPHVNTSNLVESIQSGQRVIANFVLESGETLEQFRQRVRTTFEQAGIDVAQYENVIKTATSVHAEFAKGTVKSFQTVNDVVKDTVTKSKGYFGDLRDSVTTVFKTMQNDSASFGDKIGSVGNLVSSGFNLMTGSIKIFLALDVAKKVGEWTHGLESLAEKAEDTQHRFIASTGIMSDQASKFVNDLSSKLGVSKGQIKNMMGTEYLNTRDLGFDPKTAEGMSENITKLSYDLAKLRGQDPSEVFDKLKAGIEGQPKGLSELGIRISDVDIKNKALTEGLIKHGQTLTDQQKSLVIYQELLQKTAGVQGYYSTTTNDLSTQSTKLKATFDAMKSQLASALTPAFMEFLKALNFVASGLKVVVGLVATGIQDIELFAADAYSAVKDILSLDFGDIQKDWQNNYNTIFASNDAVKQYGQSLDDAITASNDATDATNNAADAQKNLNKSVNANIMSFDQVHNITNEAANAANNQAGAVNNLANALGKLNNISTPNLNNITDNKSKGIIIPIAFGPIPKFPKLPNPPAIVASLVDKVSPVLATIQNNILQWETNAITCFNTFQTQANSCIQSVDGYLNGLNTAFNNNSTTISNWAISTNGFVNVWSINVTSNISSVVSALGSLGTAFANNTASIASWANTTGSTISSWAKNGATNIQGFTSTSTTNIANWEHNSVSNVNSFVNNTGSNIDSWASTEAKNIGAFAMNASQNMASWINSTSQGVGAWATNVSTNINAFITASDANISNWASATCQDFNSWITATSQSLVSWANSALSTIASFVTQAAATISSLASSAGASIGSGFHAVEGNVGSAVTGAANFVSSHADVIVPAALGALAVTAIVAAPFTGGASLIALPALAEGAVVTKPTIAMIGEGSEPEGVVPLSKLDGMLNKKSTNVEVQNQGNSNQQLMNITVKLDGRTLARVLRPYTVNEGSRIGTIQGYDPSFNYPK